MLSRIKKRLLGFSATVLNYLSIYCFDYKRFLSDITYEKLFDR